MLRKVFIPLTLALAMIALGLYLFSDRAHAPRDLREAVPVEKFTLRNGLQVWVMPNARIPAVTHMLMVRAGGADDPQGKSGLAHYLEHLMFSGTTDYPEDVYGKTITRMGGEYNASTGRDYTSYYATVPKNELATVMAMEVDRLQHTNFSAAAPRELNVITEERNMRVENDPSALMEEQLDAITFFNHPYRQPLIGWAEDMASFTATDAKQFFKRHYKPSNMLLLVAGDVEVRDVRRLVQRYYGNLPASIASVRHWPVEPPLRVTRSITLQDAKVQSPRLIRRYTAPSLKNGDSGNALPLALLAQYLGGGQTSVLYQKLVREQQLAVNVRADYDPFVVGPALFSITATPMPGVRLKKLEHALDAVLLEMLGTLPPEAEIKRSKTQLKAEVIFAQDGLTPLAMLMGHLAMLGLDEQYFYGWSDAVEKVTAGEVLSAAQAVLVPQRRITGYLLPEAASGLTVTQDGEVQHAP